ncbi:MAG: hypothetical protein ABI478_12530 [Propionivibrio sp.]
MKRNLDQYVGRTVRLNQQVFQEISGRSRYQGTAFENRFLVSEVSRQMRKLVCYGARLRILVAPADVVLI